MANPRTKKIVRTVYLERRQVAQLERLSARTRVPMADYIREGVDYVLEKYTEDRQQVLDRVAS